MELESLVRARSFRAFAQTRFGLAILLFSHVRSCIDDQSQYSRRHAKSADNQGRCCAGRSLAVSARSCSRIERVTRTRGTERGRKNRFQTIRYDSPLSTRPPAFSAHTSRLRVEPPAIAQTLRAVGLYFPTSLPFPRLLRFSHAKKKTTVFFC